MDRTKPRTEKRRIESVAKKRGKKKTAPDMELLDEKDVRIALELFRTGYYHPALTPKPTNAEMAERLKMRPSVFVEKKNRLEALGVDAICLKKLSEKDMRRAARSLETILRKKQF